MSQIECIGLTAVQPVCNVSIQCSDTVGWATGRASGLWKNWVMLCWWWRFDWSFARLIAPVVTTHHLQSSFALIKPANRGSPGKRPLKRREREEYVLVLVSIIIINAGGCCDWCRWVADEIRSHWRADIQRTTRGRVVTSTRSGLSTQLICHFVPSPAA